MPTQSSWIVAMCCREDERLEYADSDPTHEIILDPVSRP